MKLKVICLLILLIVAVNTSSNGGTLSSVTAIAENNQAGATTFYTFNFITDVGGIPTDGKIVITFPGALPGEFDVSGASIAQTTNNLTMNGGVTSSGAAGVITLVRDGTGTAVAGGASVGVTVAVINNHETAANYTVTVETQFGDAIEVSDEFKWEWVSIPHIYHTPFYVYAYATIVFITL